MMAEQLTPLFWQREDGRCLESHPAARRCSLTSSPQPESTGSPTAPCKGDALPWRVAGIQAAKRCADLIPLCHPLPLNHVSIEFERSSPDRLRVVATTRTIERTGVEMEALCAASIAALTIWDMVKGVDPALQVTDVTLVSKTKKEA